MQFVVVLSAFAVLTIVKFCQVQGANNCAQSTTLRVECDANTAAECKELGCWWCDNGILPKCTEGIACRKDPARNCWIGKPGTPSASVCRNEYGCSWCAGALDFPCKEDFIPDPILTCNQPLEDLVVCPEGTNEETCMYEGCWWCNTGLEYQCVRGLECSLSPMVNCWYGEATPNAADCRNKYGCSWCPDSSIKCVKAFEPPMPGLDQCKRSSSDREPCSTSVSIRKDQCAKSGCWWCGSRIKPSCIRGTACRRSIKIDCWPTSNTDDPNEEDCRIKYGCSWCPTDEENQPECLTETDECDRLRHDRDPCFTPDEETKDRKSCVDKGCFWCDDVFPRCTRGKPCGQYPRENCWPDSETDEETPKLCRRRYRCSWCPDKEPHCVKPQPLCYYKEALNCYHFNDPDISKRNCIKTDGCFFCPYPSNRRVKCTRAMCREGEIRRYRQNSCCKGETTESEIEGAMVADSDRIIGGINAQADQWPFEGSLRFNGRHFCAAFLIRRKWSLSAAHCNIMAISLLTIKYGVIDLNDAGTIVEIVSVTPHPQFTFFGSYDIMILKHDAVDLDSSINLISLPRGEITRPGTICFAIGWGLDGDGNLPDILQEADAEIVDMSQCASQYTFDNETIIGNTMICAGHPEGRTSSCSGDSGGPLVCQRCASCDWYAAGIVSFGLEGCAFAQYPAVYANLENLEEWVGTVIRGLPDADPSLNCDVY